MAWEGRREAVWTRTVSACLNPLVRPRQAISLPHKITNMNSVVLPTIIWATTEMSPCDSWSQGFRHPWLPCVARQPDHHAVQALLKIIRVILTETTTSLSLYSFKEKQEALHTPRRDSCSSSTGITKLSIFKPRVVESPFLNESNDLLPRRAYQRLITAPRKACLRSKSPRKMALCIG